MLHKETVERTTFELLKELMQDKRLDNFNLAGGTALALYIGHRKSVDLDLFTPDSFDEKDLEKYLINKYNFHSSFLEKDTLKGTINDVKIDCIAHNYPYVEEPFTLEGVRLYGIKDIVAMKLSAIADNGTRMKDFIDIAFLSSMLSLIEMLDAYEKKFPNSNKIRPLKGLTFFQDIQIEEPVQLADSSFKWEKVEKRLRDMVINTNTIFPELVMSEEKKEK
ncbi:MAG: nucleotidyl transferase AbiEii/AbiGii toxin family protein [Proteiniphilum sp.]|jgi:predicted nucleotidyltransferase component of viral defense system|nr:nucleotidyl transferase AbiEii/AbiGii toxin family protein [Proteiniphilum sp.]